MTTKNKLRIGTSRKAGEVLDCVVEEVVIHPLFKAAVCRHSEREVYACLYQIDAVTPEVGTKGTVTIINATSWRFDAAKE